MTPAEGIRKLGFRRWYERELIDGHIYLVTCLLSLIAVAVCLERIEWRGPMTQFIFMLTTIIAGGALCVSALRRYSFLMVRAQSFGAQSDCPHCNCYGMLQVVDAVDVERQFPGLFVVADNSWIRVRCKKCAHEWKMDNA
jgi:predicted nucleic-acid-binding Zn-ribbon protein